MRLAAPALALTLLSVALLPACKRASPPPSAERSAATAVSIYEVESKTLDGKPVTLARYRGQVALLVNVASECGYTPQYAGLQQLYAR